MLNNILIRIGLNSSGFRQGMDDMRNSVQQLRGNLTSMVAGALGGGAMLAGIKASIEYADKIKKLSDRFGVSTTILQKWGHAAEQNGAALDNVADAFKDLENNRSKALQGDEALIEVFGRLGVSIEDLKTNSPEELMLKIGASGMEAADAVAVLGEAAVMLKPALLGIADGSIELGAAMDEHVIRNLSKVADQMREVQQEITTGLGTIVVWFANIWKTAMAANFTIWQMFVESVASGSKVIGYALTGNLIKAGQEAKKWKQEMEALGTAFVDVTKEQWTGADEEKKPEKPKRDTEDVAAQKAAQKEAEDAVKKREEAIKRLREREEEAARAALEGQEKINALIKERERLLNEAEDSRDTDAAVKAAEDAQRISRQIEDETKKQAEEKAKAEKEAADEIAEAAKEAAEEQKKKHEEISQAREREEEAKEAAAFEKLTPEQQLAELTKRKAKLDREAAEAEKTDPAKAADLRTEAIEVQRDIDQRKKEQQDEQKSKAEEAMRDAAEKAKPKLATVTADSLQRVGGGGFGSKTHSDPGVKAAQEQVSIQRQILAKLNAMEGGNGGKLKAQDDWK